MEELNLLNIVSINQDHLKKNFSLLLNKIKQHDQLILTLNQKIQNSHNVLSQNINQSQSASHLYIDEQLSTIKKRTQDVIENNLQSIHLKIQNQILKLEQKAKEDLNYQCNILNNSINKQKQIINLKVDDFTQLLRQELYTKQNTTEAQKIKTEIYQTQQQLKIFENQIKYVQHHIEKIIILSEKAERQKLKKQKQNQKNNGQKNMNNSKYQINNEKNIHYNISSKKDSKKYLEQEASTIKQISQNNICSGSKFVTKAQKEFSKKNSLLNQSKKEIIFKQSLQTINTIDLDIKQKKNNQLGSIQSQQNQQKVESYIQKNRQSQNTEKISEKQYLQRDSQSNNRQSEDRQTLSILKHVFPIKTSTVFTPFDPDNQLKSNPNYSLLINLIQGLQNKLKKANQRLNQFQKINEQFKKQNQALMKQNSQPIEKLKQQISEIKQQNNKQKTQFIFFQDRISSAQKKLEENSKNILKINQQLRTNGFTKLQQKIKQIQTELTTSIRDMKAKLDGKANQIQYQKYRQSLQQRLNNMNNLINIKADKIEVKKALLFLQSKLKQIILVISNQQNNQKEALLTKKQLKCMSCDKDVDPDKFVGSVSLKKTNWDSMPLKQVQIQNLGRFGLTNFGTLTKKNKLSTHNSNNGSILPNIDKKKGSNSICY